jgi:hypothetical protein
MEDQRVDDAAHASIITLVFAAGHTLGGWQSWSPPGESEVFRAMRSFRFDADGVSRTYWDFYIGFGLMISVSLLAQAVVLWQLAGVSKKDAALVWPIVGVLFASAVATAALAWRFFFTVPLVMALTLALSLGTALAAAPRPSIQR